MSANADASTRHIAVLDIKNGDYEDVIRYVQEFRSTVVPGRWRAETGAAKYLTEIALLPGTRSLATNPKAEPLGTFLHDSTSTQVLLVQ
jgi:hypothetical protein